MGEPIGAFAGLGLGIYTWTKRRELNGETKLIVGIAIALGLIVETVMEYDLLKKAGLV